MATDSTSAALLELLGGDSTKSKMKYSLSGFLGMFPRYQAYLIKDSASQTAIDVNTLSGGLEAFRQDSVVLKTDKLYKDVYRYVHDDINTWLFFDKHVNIVRSAVIDDVNNQTYITGYDNLRVFDSNTLVNDVTLDSTKTITTSNSYKAGITRPVRPTISTTQDFITTTVYEAVPFFITTTASASASSSATTLNVAKPTVNKWPATVSTGAPLALSITDSVTGSLEKVSCTGVDKSNSSYDKLTIVRAQGGTTAITINAGSTIMAGTNLIKVAKPVDKTWPTDITTVNTFRVTLTAADGKVEIATCTDIDISNAGYDVLTLTRATATTTASDAETTYSSTALPLAVGDAVKELTEKVVATRTYAISYVREWYSGKIDLGPISDPARTTDSLTYVDVIDGQKVIVSDMVANPTADEHADYIQIYRSAVSNASSVSSATANWREVIKFSTKVGAVLPAGVTYDSATHKFTFTDNILDENLGSTPVNVDWTCPDNLQGIVSLRNGVFAAYSNNTVYFSVAYQGHAWPEAYAIPLDYKIVGLGCFGNTLVICTTATTFLCTVSNPENVILIPLQEACACVSAQSIVSMQEAVVFATDFGLVKITNNGILRSTNSILSERAWRRFAPSTIRACVWNGQYLMFFDTTELPYSGCVMDLTDLSTGIFGLSQKVSCIRKDDYSSDVYIQYVHPILRTPCVFTFATSSSLKRIYRWVSKKFINALGLFNIACGKVNFYDDSTYIENKQFVFLKESNAFNATYVNKFSLAGDASTNEYMQQVYNTKWCKFTLYLNDKEYSTVYAKDNTPFRLPAGKRGDSFYVEIVSTEPIARVQVAASIGELE